MKEEIFFRRIYEYIEVPIFVLHVDVDGDFVFGGMNPACEKATGLRKEDVLSASDPKKFQVFRKKAPQRCGRTSGVALKFKELRQVERVFRDMKSMLETRLADALRQ